MTNVVPFVPPIPDHVTDEDMLLALQQIPPHHQEVILLCDVEDMTYKEIAAALEVPIGTVMSRLHRGRELLRTELARRGAGPAAIGSGKRDTLIMQCRDVRELADSFLSEQLLVETNHELLRHLDTCPDCRADIAGRRALRDGLRAAFARAEDLRPRPEFAAELLATLRPASQPTDDLETLGAAIVVGARRGPCPCRRRRVVRAPLELAIAPGALAREAAGDHQNCAVKFNLAERPIPLEEAGRRYGAPYAALATFELPAVDGSLEMLERHSCVYQGRRFGHVVFRYRGALTSLLVTDGAPPAAPELEPNDSGSRRGVAAGRTVPRIRRRRSRSSVRLAPGADTRGTAVATPRLIALASTSAHCSAGATQVDRSDAAHRHGRAASRADGR